MTLARRLPAQPDIDAAVADVAEAREWAVSIRARIPQITTADELDRLDAVLVGLRQRLRQLGAEATEAERSRIIAWQRKGELFGEPEPEFHGNRHTGSRGSSVCESSQTLDRSYADRWRARLLHRYREAVAAVLSGSSPSLNKAINKARGAHAAAEAAKTAARMAAEVITVSDPEDESVDIDQDSPSRPWWQLGRHLLYCGDSTDPEFVERATGAGAQLAFADPPYNAGKADWDSGFAWIHDYLADAAEVVLVTPGISAIADFFAVTGMPYRWSVAAHITNGMTRGALGFGNWIYVGVFSRASSIHRNAQDHMELTVDASTTYESSHESRKPARLLVNLIEMFTDEGDVVIDPFLGSGTTLFAADATGRECIGAEVNPAFQAEIITRYGAGAVQLP